MFELDAQFQKDCLVLGKLELCHLLLMNDSNYPWFILVPERENIAEIYELAENDQQLLQKESSRLAEFLATNFKADKINVAALGNVVRQLHIHHIVRYKDDDAWPAPVWGAQPAKPYTKDRIREITSLLKLLV